MGDLAECSTDENGNIIDPITGEIIPEDRLITVPEPPIYYCFDIETLYREVQEGRTRNPYTRNPLPQKVLDEIQAYGEKIKLEFMVYELYPSIETSKLDRIGDLMLSVYERLPDKYEAIPYALIQINHQPANDYNWMDPVSSLDFTQTQNTITILRGTAKRLSRIQRVYDYVSAVGRTGVADYLRSLFPEIKPAEKPEEAIGSAAAEQQQRVQEQIQQEREEASEASIALVNAAASNNLEEARSALENGADPYYDDAAALRVAVANGHRGIVNYLTEYMDAHPHYPLPGESRIDAHQLLEELGDEPDDNDMEEATLQLIDALNRNHFEDAAQAAPGANLEDIRVINAALQKGRQGILNYLVRHHGLSVGTDEGYPLIAAAQLDNISALKLLLDYGRDIEQYYSVALTSAVQYNNVGAAAILLAYGANPLNAEKNLLLDAINNNNGEMVELLLDHGADAKDPRVLLLAEEVMDDPDTVELLRARAVN